MVIDITAGQKVDRRHITNQHEKKGSPGGGGVLFGRRAFNVELTVFMIDSSIWHTLTPTSGNKIEVADMVLSHTHTNTHRHC